VIYDLIIKAGKNTLPIIRDGGFDWNRITTYYGSASGPRWLVTSGFDLSLLREGCLGRNRSLLLAGASSGAWRFAAWPQPEPEKSYLDLRQAYIETEYRRNDTPRSVRQLLMRIVDQYVEEDAIPFALQNKQYRLAIISARARHLTASEKTWLQKIGLGLCFTGNLAFARTIQLFFERVIFYTGPKPPSFCLNGAFSGRYIPLNKFNFKHAVLSSGAIPLVVAGVKDIFGAPRGIYRDGGLVDYHINEIYTNYPDEITLFFHHQPQIKPTWMDKNLKSRRSPAHLLDNVLMVYPTPTFVSTLPDAKIPDRTDFVTYVDDQAQRIRNWQQAVEQSAHLGEEFMELVASGRIRNAVLPLD
jgi:hypothetical protein